MSTPLPRMVLLVLIFGAIYACNDGQNPPSPSPAPAPAPSKDVPCDGLAAFQRLTGYDTITHKFGDIQREIKNEDDIKNIANYFYTYTSSGLRIDTARGATNPRLSLGVDFNGPTLLDWIKKMDAAGATRIKVLFGMYTFSFLQRYLDASETTEYNNRVNRFTAVLVAYKLEGTNKDKETFIGGYNLGGMQP